MFRFFRSVEAKERSAVTAVASPDLAMCGDGSLWVWLPAHARWLVVCCASMKRASPHWSCTPDTC